MIPGEFRSLGRRIIERIGETANVLSHEQTTLLSCVWETFNEDVSSFDARTFAQQKQETLNHHLSTRKARDKKKKKEVWHGPWIINEIDHAPMAPVEWRVEGVLGMKTKRKKLGGGGDAVKERSSRSLGQRIDICSWNVLPANGREDREIYIFRCR